MSNTEIVKNKYLKYKNKYINLKKMLGRGSPMEGKCLICPTKDQVIEQLEHIITLVPEGCIKYTFISDELNRRYKEHYRIVDHSILYLPDSEHLNEEYENYLREIFFNREQVNMNTQSRLVVTSYNELAKNSASIEWHQDTENYDRTFYNILYYLTLENCRHDCGTEIAFRKSESEIITIKLPIIEGLILALKDDCFSHKSPVISLINPNEFGTRLIIRTYAQFQKSEEISERNTKISFLSRELNLKKLEDCLEKYFNEETEISLKKDCYNFIKRYYVDREYYDVNNIFDKYYNDHKEFFDSF
jgi:hypothetical protein